MRPSEKETTIATFSVACSAFTYGSVPIFLRFFINYLDAWTVNAVRYTVAAMLLLPFVLILMRRSEEEKRAAARLSAPKSGAGPQSIWRAALVPSVINIIGQVLWALSPYYKVGAATMGFTTKSSFLFTVLFGFLLIPKERLLGKKPLFFVGAAVCLAGLVIMFLQKMLTEGGSSLTGMGILVATAVFWGAYAVSVRLYLGGYPLRLSFGVVSLYTAGALVALMLIFGDYSAMGELGDETVKIWLLLAASAVIGMVFSHLLYYRGIHGLGPVISNGILMATPFLTYLGAWIFLDEKMTWIQMLGGFIIVAGGVILVRSRARIERRKARPSEFVAPDR
ncbi:MAG: DMT family transporter [Planctomycetota bacterium]|nr:DMT family transporter [Planctomycetota bacterium]